jgi:hypothetical protein
MEWKDETSYSQSERRGKATPRTWVLQIPGCDISVSTKIWDNSGTYYMGCRHLNLSDVDLGTTDPDVAKIRAINRVEDILRSLTLEVEKAKRDLK